MSAPRPGGLYIRLLVAIGAVLAVAGATTWIVALILGPAIFHDHIVEGAAGASEAAVEHAELAFDESSTRALAIGSVLGVVAALAVSVWITRKLGGSLQRFAQAARDIAGGELAARVPDPGMGQEFGDLATAFNSMAERLDASEALRRRAVADVAHELRTPVATMSGYLEALEDGVAEWDADTIALLRSQGERIARLARDLADVTHAESGELVLDRQDVNLGEMLAQTARAAHERAASASVEVSAEGGENVTVSGDPVRLAQVLDNLVSNAIRHTPAGGRVTLAAARHMGEVELRVRDTGDGIAAEHLSYVFERFYRVDDARDRESGGSGIGLAIVKALVAAHGGSVRAESDGLGHGTTVIVTLAAL